MYDISHTTEIDKMTSHSALLGYPWIVLGAIWLVAAAGKKAAIQKQPNHRRLIHVLLAVLGFGLLAHPWFHRGWLGTRFVPDTTALYFIGFGLTVAGALFAVWARFTLGGNWSGQPSLMAGHELVTSGPYAVARHPIYTGLIFAAAGTALAIGEARSLLGVLVILLAFTVKISEEERLMMQAFPHAYPTYRQRVKALIPGVL